MKPYLLTKSEAGMTLIEVLIALAIIGIALTAVIKASSQNIRATQYLQQKVMASWVGQDVLNRIRLNLLSATTDGVQEKTQLLGKTWFWKATKQETANKEIKKIEVRVYAKEPDDKTTALLELEGFIKESDIER